MSPMRKRMKSKAGQVLVLLALMVVLLFGAIGLAVDAAIGYLYSIGAERAAASGALAGVIFMPNQLSPCCSGQDATDRAIAEAKQNGFDTADVLDSVTVTAAGVPISGASCPCWSNQLQVTVSRTVPTFFMQIFGFSRYTVSRTAQAGYLPPIGLGQKGAQFGAATSQLAPGVKAFFGNEESWNNTRLDGDAYSPNPTSNPVTTTDLHQISNLAGTEPAYAGLSNRGGYNYLITIGAGGGRIEVYNAAFGPDYAPAHNNCDNHRNPAAGSLKRDVCSTSASLYLGEEYGFTAASPATWYAAARYTIFTVPNLFIRSSDVMVTQSTVLSIDATHWDGTPAGATPGNTPTYRNVNTGATITQTYNAVTGAPTNMLIYHAWADVATYTEPAPNASMVSYTAGLGPYAGALPAGTYRLRVDNLNNLGTAVQGAGSLAVAAHSYSVEVTDASGVLCATSACGKISAWKEMGWFTPITSASAIVPLFQLPPDYAGKTISVDIFDPGDMHGGSGSVWLDVILPDGVTTSPVTSINNLGASRVLPGSVIAGTGPGAHVQVFFPGACPSPCEPYDGLWVDFQIPVPASYAATVGTNPDNWWWSLKYSSSLGVGGVGFDALDTVVGLKGNPSHLIQG